MLQQLTGGIAWNVLGVLFFLAAIGTALYCYWDADREAKGLEKYGE